MRPLRSLLNVPGNRPEMIDKAPGFGADALILDLEDAVPLDRKTEGRETVAGATAHWAGTGPVTYVRVNALESGLLEDDLMAIVGRGLEGIQLPKVHDVETIHHVDGLLAELERERGLPQGGIEILVSLESARGVLSAFQILTAAPRVGSVMVGTAQDADLQGDVGYVTTPAGLETLYIRSQVILAARAAGIDNPIDGVYADHRDLEGFELAARRARALGYRGKKLIHPAQIEIAHRVFTPTEDELELYRRILDAFDVAVADGRATAVLDGRMIDIAMAETARRALERADIATEKGESEVRRGS
jgi:citrate lyase subunit beta / citryl-CoA lyase